MSALCNRNSKKGRSTCGKWNARDSTKTIVGWPISTPLFNGNRHRSNCYEPRVNWIKYSNKIERPAYMLDTKSLDILAKALEQLDAGFHHLPEFASHAAHIEKMTSV